MIHSSLHSESSIYSNIDLTHEYHVNVLYVLNVNTLTLVRYKIILFNVFNVHILFTIHDKYKQQIHDYI